MVSKDIPLRVKAGAVGLSADEYHAQDVITSGWTGMDEIEVSPDEIDTLFADGEIDLEAARNLPCHTGIRLLGGSSHALGRVNPEKRVQLVRGDREVFGLRGRSAEQRVALDLLLDESIGIVSLGGKAGTGKSALALCAGLEAVLERRTHRKVVVFRPLYAVGGQDLGYLPGSESEKMGPWAQAVFDTLEGLASPAVLEEVLSRGMLEVLPLTHIRGRSLHDSFVIVDEAQSLERNVLLTVLSRLGAGSRVVLTHDVAQRDNLRVGRHDGVAAVIEKLKGHPLFAHITLLRSERSPIAALVTEMLEEISPGRFRERFRRANVRSAHVSAPKSQPGRLLGCRSDPTARPGGTGRTVLGVLAAAAVLIVGGLTGHVRKASADDRRLLTGQVRGADVRRRAEPVHRPAAADPQPTTTPSRRSSSSATRSRPTPRAPSASPTPAWRWPTTRGNTPT